MENQTLLIMYAFQIYMSVLRFPPNKLYICVCNFFAVQEDEHVHYSHRAPWLRAFVLGANDGLVSVAAIMLGVSGGSDQLNAMWVSVGWGGVHASQWAKHCWAKHMGMRCSNIGGWCTCTSAMSSGRESMSISNTVSSSSSNI